MFTTHARVDTDLWPHITTIMAAFMEESSDDEPNPFSFKNFSQKSSQPLPQAPLPAVESSSDDSESGNYGFWLVLFAEKWIWNAERRERRRLYSHWRCWWRRLVVSVRALPEKIVSEYFRWKWWRGGRYKTLQSCRQTLVVPWPKYYQEK